MILTGVDEVKTAPIDAEDAKGFPGAPNDAARCRRIFAKHHESTLPIARKARP